MKLSLIPVFILSLAYTSVALPAASSSTPLLPRSITVDQAVKAITFNYNAGKYGLRPGVPDFLEAISDAYIKSRENGNTDRLTSLKDKYVASGRNPKYSAVIDELSRLVIANKGPKRNCSVQ